MNNTSIYTTNIANDTTITTSTTQTTTTTSNTISATRNIFNNGGINLCHSTIPTKNNNNSFNWYIIYIYCIYICCIYIYMYIYIDLYIYYKNFVYTNTTLIHLFIAQLSPEVSRAPTPPPSNFRCLNPRVFVYTGNECMLTASLSARERERERECTL